MTVTAPGGTSAANPPGDQFTYIAAPTVTAVSPNSGPAAGGTGVTITGTGFTGATAVDFGGSNAATGVIVNSDTSISATSPSGSGTVDVTVTAPGGTSAANPPGDQFTYVGVPPAPTVTAVSPNSGPAAGGTGVTITGTGFTGATAVDFGGSNAATGVIVNSDTSISATSPSGSGTVDVTVTAPGGTSAANPPGDQFTYIAAPTVTAVSPNSGPAAGGTGVTVTGTGFTGATAVKFGTNSATSFTIHSDTSISATSPSGSGTVDVTVTAPGGTSAANPPGDQFTYVAAAGFQITTSSLPDATPGVPYGPGGLGVVLQTSGSGPGATFKWKKGATLPKSLKLTKGGVLMGTINPKHVTVGSNVPVSVQVTETVITPVEIKPGKFKGVKTKTTASKTLILHIA